MNRSCYSIVLFLFVFASVRAEEVSIEAVEKQLSGKVAHISNLTFNINVQPKQIIKDIKQDLFMFFCKVPDVPIRQYSSAFLDNLHQYRYHIGGATVAAFYCYLCYEVIRANRYIGSSDAWSSWKKDMSLPELLDAPSVEMERELLLEIQRRYTCVDKPTDFISSLVSFMQDIEQEIKHITYVATLNTWIKKLRLVRIFPMNSKRFAQLEEKRARLSYVRSLFLTWAAQYKLEQNKNCTVDIG